MTKASGTAAELLNLPSGGGSVSGQGGDFSVDLNTGTATAKFDFSLPAGPNGIRPPVTLQYSAGSGDGPFGIGWSLGLMTIRTKITPAPADLTATGTFSLAGVGDLVAMGAGRYRPVTDSTGLLIQFTSGSWTVTDKAGLTCTLGSTGASRLPGSPPAAWLLDSCRDSAGNAVTFSWAPAGGALVPQSIAWGTYQLVFGYESRPDVVLDGSYGPPVLLATRCSGAELHVTTEAQSLVRSWSFRYDDGGGRGRSLLAVIGEQGHGADGSVLAAPDQTYAYSVPGAPAMVQVTGWTAPLTSADTDLADLNGDGLPDLVRLGSGVPSMHPNLGGGAFGPPHPLAQSPEPFRLSGTAVTFADMSGDGNVDVLVLARPFSGYYPLSAPAGGRPAFGPPVIFRQAPAVTPGDPDVRFLDLNGDGITDVLVDTGRSWLIYLRENTDTWSGRPVVLPPERTPPLSLADPHVYLADMTGDGLTDIVLARGGGVTYWPARADGGWGTATELSPAPVFGRNHDPARLSLADVDGDGCADLVYVGAQSVTVWRTTGATSLADPVTVPATPPAAPGSFRIADLLGTGTAGVLFQLPVLHPGDSRQAFLDLAGGVKPYLLTDMAYGAARSTHISYRASTGFALDDAAAGAPWPTYHPFPVQCVARTDQTDHGAGVTASSIYRYHDGRYDPATRAFLGFGRVESDQLGDASCPALRVVTTFHLGLDPDDPGRPLSGDEALRLGSLRRKPLSTATYGMDGTVLEQRPYSMTWHTYAALLVPSSLPGGDQVAVPYCATSAEQRWERQAAPVSTRTVSYLAVTSEGDITAQRTQAQRTGAATPDQDVTTTTTLATGGTSLRLPARVTQTAPDGTVISAAVFYYDGDPFTGLPEGQATAGLITRIEDLAFDDAFVTSVWGADPPDLTRYGYHRLPGDPAGWWKTRRAHQRITCAGPPALATRGPLGAVQTVTYDQAGQRVAEVTDAAGNTMTATSDPRVFQTASVTDANGGTTADVFDTLGRVTATTGPLDSAALPLATFSYTAGAVSVVQAAHRVTHGTVAVVPTTTWLDGSGQVLGKSTPGAAPGQWTVSDATARNGRGMITAAYLPYAVTGPGWQPPPAGTGAITSAYDALGRVVSSTRPDGLVITTRREGDTVVISETRPGGTAQDVERQTYDAAGQLIAVSRNAGDHWAGQQYSYAPCGKVNAVTLPDGSQVTMAVDLLGRMFSHQSPDTGTTLYLLDACDNQRSRVNAAGQVIRTDVDAMNRVTGVYHDAETVPRIRYEYLDAGGTTPADGITAGRHARVWRVTDEIGTVVFQYDEAGHVTSSARTVAVSGQEFINQVGYDALGRCTSVTLPAPAPGGTGRTVEYGYGPDGHPVSATGVVTSAEHDLYGRVTSISYANGASTLIDYLPDAGGVQRVRVLDAAGNVLRDTTSIQADGLLAALTSAAPEDDSVTFGYDGLRRLTQASYAPAAGVAEGLAEVHTWSFDDSFTLTASSDSGALTYRPGTRQLASADGIATTFDPAGRRTAGRFGTAAFDAADRLTGVVLPDGTQLTHAYDYRGRRSLSTAAGVQTYVSPVENVEIAGTTTVIWIQFGGQRVAADVGGALTIAHPNALGGTDLLTDANGAYVTRVRQTPFGVGRPGGSAPPPGSAATLVLLILGTDPSGLVCQGQRWYDPLTGQFLSPDPLIASVYTVGAWSPYLLCLGNPVMLADPTGRSFLSVLEIIGIAILAAAAFMAVVTVPASAALVALTVCSASSGGWFLAGVAIGALGGAFAGELAAQKAGGNLWEGAFIGALLGGTTALIGGALGGAAASALQGLGGASGWTTLGTIVQYAVSGLIQGTIAGAGTGLATALAAGKGTAESILTSVGLGAAWGAVFGTVIGGGLGYATTLAKPPGGISGWAYIDKFFNSSSATGSLNSYFTDIGVVSSVYQLTGPQYLSGITGLVPAALSPFQPVELAIMNWAAGAGAFYSGFAAIVNVTMAIDQAGYSYAQQFSLLLSLVTTFIPVAGPVIGDALKLTQIYDPSGYSQVQAGFNNAFGSANPNSTN
jgi:RHS repeat-associated protein